MDELMKWIEQALLRGERMDSKFYSNGRHWVLSLKPVGEPAETTLAAQEHWRRMREEG